MTEFWESSFREKQEMWGWEPADSAIRTLELFKKYALYKILIPGFGYGSMPWLASKEGEEINYELVFYRDAPFSVRNYGDEIEEQ